MQITRRRDGFTLIELLTVIAIIGILAALIFPVAATARKKANETKCISNMMQIYTGVKQFQLDEHRYPDYIAGPALTDSNGVTIPLEKSTGLLPDGKAVALFPEYLNNSVAVLKCPSAANGASGTEYSTIHHVADPFVAYRYANAELYQYSSYDWQDPKGGDGTGEVHYSPSRMDVKTDRAAAMADPDVERQLIWRNPPSDTIITWCSYHRNGDGRGPGNRDLVLYLDGQVRRVQSTVMSDWISADPKIKNGWRAPIQN